MRSIFLSTLLLLSTSLGAQVRPGPTATPLAAALPEPEDRPFQGTVQLLVDAADTAHGIRSVVWNGTALQAGLAPGDTVTGVDGRPFTPANLLAAVSRSSTIPVRLTLQAAAGREVTIGYAGPLRYRHLKRIPGTPDRLTPLLLAR